jgi:4-hydroxy-2-oxoheptanedioate aldolase
MRNSTVLAKLRGGKPAICVKTNLTDPKAVEIMGMVGFDCVWLCNEHIPTDWGVMENQIRAAKLHDMDSLVRVAKGSYSDYIRPLEADATGIMVPHVFTGDEAKGVVKTTRFMPVGRRPVDGGNIDGEFCLVPPAKYAEHANREKFVIVQIEDPEAMEQVDEICSVPGIDVVFFGPGDYSHAIGRMGDAGHADVLKARRRVAESCRKHKRWAGVPASPQTARALIDEGFLFLAMGADVIAIGQYFASIRADLEKINLL